MGVRRGRGSADQSRPSRTIPYRRAYLAAVAAFALISWWAAGLPHWGLGWLVLAAASLLVCAALAAVVPRALPRLLGRHPRAPALVVAVVLMATIAGVPAGAAAGLVIGGREPPLARSGCDPEDPAVELRVVAAPSQLATIQLLAAEYELWTARMNDGCPTVRSHVYEQPFSAVNDSLASGWSDLPSLGPRPDVWVPDSVSQVTEGRESLAAENTRLDGLVNEVVGWSPLVLAVSESASLDASQSQRDGSSWQELVALAGDSDWRLIRPDPAASVAGRMVNTALYGSPGTGEDNPVQARDLEVEIARSLDEGGYQLGDGDTLLCRHQQRGAEGERTALLVSEQAVARFNRGDSLSHTCPAIAAAPEAVAASAPAAKDPAAAADGGCAASAPLVAFYPADTLAITFPVVKLSWQPRDTPHAEAAHDFQGWLLTEDGRAALVAAGWRPTGSATAEAGAPLPPECGGVAGALAGEEYADRAPSAEAMARAQQEYANAQRPGRVLVAVDVSESMANEVGDGVSRFEIAMQAVAAALRRLGPKDEFGLRVFPDRGGDPDLVEIGPADEPYQGVPRDDAALAALESLTPGGGTPLHRTIVEGTAEVGAFEDGVAALVVVTDGEDTERNSSINEQLQDLNDAAGVRVHVVAIGEASCGINAIAGVVQRTSGGCLEPDFATLDAELGDLFGVLWSGG